MCVVDLRTKRALGFGDLLSKNIALAFHLQTSLWNKVIRSKFGWHSNGWDTIL